jgi:hypothetical protein
LILWRTREPGAFSSFGATPDLQLLRGLLKRSSPRFSTMCSSPGSRGALLSDPDHCLLLLGGGLGVGSSRRDGLIAKQADEFLGVLVQRDCELKRR